MKKEICREDFNITIIFPPQWSPQNPPHRAVTKLAGHLRHHGYKVNLRDLNVEFYDKILTPDYIELSKAKIMMLYEKLKFKVFLKCNMGQEDEALHLDSDKMLYIEKYLKEEQETWNNTSFLIDEAVSAMRDPERFYEANVLVDALIIIEDALKIISMPYYPSCFGFNDFYHPRVKLELKDILPYCTDLNQNMFYEYYKEVLPGIVKEEPDLICISLNSSTQVLPAMTLAKMIRTEAPHIHVHIGGDFFGRLKENLLKLPGFFRNFCHTIMIGEGEKFLVELADTLRTGGNLSKVPSILYMEEEEVKYTFKGVPEKMDHLGFQDLADLKLYKYFTHDIVLCIESSKGCYWGKCTFCDTDFGVEHDVKSLDRLVKEIKHLRDNYNIRHYEFVDESIKPEYMRMMAERFIEEDLGIYWFCNGRLESAFNKDLMELLHKSGLTMVLWGFESGNNRIMKLINKGIELERRYDILKASSDVGIWNFAYIFFGFPTETKEEAMDTINAMCEKKDIIHSYGRSIFTLGKHSILRTEAENYGIVDIIIDNQELSTNLYYRPTSGMTQEEVHEMINICKEKAMKAHGRPLWMYLKYRENLHLYLAKHGKDYLKDYPTQDWYMAAMYVW